MALDQLYIFRVNLGVVIGFTTLVDPTPMSQKWV